MGSWHSSRRSRLGLLALSVVAASGLIAWTLLSGDSGTNRKVDRGGESVGGRDDAVVLVTTPAQDRQRRLEASGGTVKPVDAAAQPVSGLGSTPTSARFSVRTVDSDGVPVPGISAFVTVVRHERDENSVSVLAPGAGALNLFGRPTYGPARGDVIHRTDGPALVGGIDGELVLELPDVEVGPGRLIATFEFRVADDSPFAAPESVAVPANESRTVSVARGGSIEVRLAPLPGGVIPHVRSGFLPYPFTGRAPTGHADVFLLLYRGLDVEQSAGRALEVDTMRWDHLSPGTYELRAQGPDWAGGHVLATLPRLVVDAGGTCDDARLAAWNPFAGRDVMYLTVEGPDGSPPPNLTVGFGAPGESERWWSNRRTEQYDGRVLPIAVPSGFRAAVTLQAPGSRRAVLDIEPGARHVALETAIELELTIVLSPEMVADPTPIRAQLVHAWKNHVDELGATTETLVGERAVVRRALPAPGRYMVRVAPNYFLSDGGGELVAGPAQQDFESVTFEVEDAPVVRRTIRLVQRN